MTTYTTKRGGRKLQQEIKMSLSLEQYSKVSGIPFPTVCKMVMDNELDYITTDNGIRIKVTYRWETPD